MQLSELKNDLQDLIQAKNLQNEFKKYICEHKENYNQESTKKYIIATMFGGDEDEFNRINNIIARCAGVQNASQIDYLSADLDSSFKDISNKYKQAQQNLINEAQPVKNQSKDFKIEIEQLEGKIRNEEEQLKSLAENHKQEVKKYNQKDNFKTILKLIGCACLIGFCIGCPWVIGAVTGTVNILLATIMSISTPALMGLGLIGYHHITDDKFKEKRKAAKQERQKKAQQKVSKAKEALEASNKKLNQLKSDKSAKEQAYVGSGTESKLAQIKQQESELNAIREMAERYKSDNEQEKTAKELIKSAINYFNQKIPLLPGVDQDTKNEYEDNVKTKLEYLKCALCEVALKGVCLADKFKEGLAQIEQLIKKNAKEFMENSFDDSAKGAIIEKIKDLFGESEHQI